MRWYRHPLATLGLCWLLVSGLFVFAMCSLPAPRTLTEAPTPRPAMTVLPTVYVFASSTPSPTVTARELIPMTPSTRVPATPTFTPIPATATPTPNTTQKPVQRG